MDQAQKDARIDELQRRRRFYEAQLRALGRMDYGHMMMFGDEAAMCAVPKDHRFDFRQMLINWYTDGIARITDQMEELTGGEENG